jgi:hypothetical protein
MILPDLLQIPVFEEKIMNSLDHSIIDDELNPLKTSTKTLMRSLFLSVNKGSFNVSIIQPIQGCATRASNKQAVYFVIYIYIFVLISWLN